MLRGSSFDERDKSDELLSTIPEILSGVDTETLDAIFKKWMIRLQQCIDGNRECAEWCLNWNVQLIFLNAWS
jgi:hypothetical protein